MPPHTPKMSGTYKKHKVQLFFQPQKKKKVYVLTDLDVGQCQEVLGDVNNKFVHESRSNVETVQFVVQLVPTQIR